jgi:hypothetical protein
MKAIIFATLAGLAIGATSTAIAMRTTASAVVVVAGTRRPNAVAPRVASAARSGQAAR